MEREQIFIDPFKGPSAVLFIKAFTLWTIYPEIVFLAGWSTMLVLLDHHVAGLSLRLPPTILTVLGTVIGFVLSYRTSSAYERYTEGRKQWSTIVHTSRTLACLIWSHCNYPLRLPTASQPATELERLRGIIERKTFINLVEGFAVSLKHYLRGEHGIYYEDLYHLACYLPKYHFPTSLPLERHDLRLVDQKDEEHTNPTPQHTNPTPQQTTITHRAVPAHTSVVVDRPTEERRPPSCTPAAPFPPPHQLLPNYNPPEEKLCECMPFAIFKSIWKGTRNATGLRKKKKANYSRRIHDDNIPLEMICCMSGYIATMQRRGVLNVPLCNSLLASVSSLSESLATLERILTTPIPFGYIVHLKLIIWGYLIFFPFQLMSTFGYVTIPATALISITFLGFLKIGEEIENPFGYDSNDLDMDHFCQNLISRELSGITGLPPPDPEEFMFSPFNLPLFRQGDDRSAADLARSRHTINEIQTLLRTKASTIQSHMGKK
ncbi:hypothetical protein MJO28_013328 [Puccinia striiformis f. sp. tritici]|uniref:Uncharacterized protein n=3 Tax=Puccinia striiformis TaxID=27350 RepID=A0A0L0VXL5_9BASI|nr:hypothetical protein Pst134EA_024212 [Puccinia striiformis f. sp. tritici]KAI9606673.1 hypothetical protein H4Q26_006209 [Puccinia striiformis f. sp. tritici PST-130]KNF03996.1 hypothetical protein PSTG_02705 [Puccinia striiformis f. sp. tritici PST-78]POW15919.1 hypothetical protein PSTT_01802 [Puccinia striiformis]KAH9444638.1 hypothetical protein Pst134EB_024897 [Puccinia striiformis f. sp. tritici]KAH9453336.1 hypothetical protein Pst134EA_024212 [Puccinia striiformis f. sp. tritici]